jgi:D-amino peptidase
MMFGLDDSFTAAVYTGYHSKAGTEDNPLAHYLRTSRSRGCC